MEPLVIDGAEFHQIGMPFHYGQSETSPVTGDSPNDLLNLTLEPNVFIQNSKVSAVDIQPGRRPRGAERLDMLREYQERAGLTIDSGNELLQVGEEETAKGNPEEIGFGFDGNDGSGSEKFEEGHKGS